MTKKVEVLAPAGSLDICKAVIRAGADAVYLGGDMYGARAYAGNLNREELLEAIEFAHLRGAKIYLTVNTLLKEKEITRGLTDFIAPYYEAGLDAAIVQDLGVFGVLKSEFPELALHASTQMAITGSYGASLLKCMGASRIVTARELTAGEIRDIHSKVDIEIESFVHGALCYCYSGMCLLSSMNGTRSGNRGRCAQNCRLAYDVYGASDASAKRKCDESCIQGVRINKNGENYPLSPKDMCTVEVLPDVIDAGVYSLKIEGRMKNVTYAADVTSIYRKYADMYLEKGRDGYRVSADDLAELMDIYNRGGFNQGYYNAKKGRAMMSVERPNHMGTLALEVIANVDGKVTFKALCDINPQDVFEIDSDNSFMSGASYRAGDKMVVNLPRRYRLFKGKKIYRTRNNRIVQKVAEEYADNNRNGNAKADMRLEAYAGQPLKLTLSSQGVEVTVYGDCVERAVKSASDKDSIRQKLCKLGNTAFVSGTIITDVSDDAFVPAAWINDIRRQGIERLGNAILEQYKRIYTPQNVFDSEIRRISDDGTKKFADKDDRQQQSVLVSTREQLASVERMLENGEYVATVYIEREIIQGEYSERKPNEPLCSVIDRIKGFGVQTAAALPHIITEHDHAKILHLIKECGDLGIDTYLVRNLEQIGILGEAAMGANVVTDAGIYCWNSHAARMIRSMVESCGLKLLRVTYPYELTASELRDIDTDCPTELVVSSWVPVMVSKQCVRKTYGMCDMKNGTVSVRDGKNREYRIFSKCDYCYTLMNSPQRLEIDTESDTVSRELADCVRFEYSVAADEVTFKNRTDMDYEKGFKAHLITGVE